MATTFHEERQSTPVVITDDDTWQDEIAAVDHAVSALLEAKRKLLRTDPQYETVLWSRNYERLRTIKRKLDAICL